MNVERTNGKITSLGDNGCIAPPYCKQQQGTDSNGEGDTFEEWIEGYNGYNLRRQAATNALTLSFISLELLDVVASINRSIQMVRSLGTN